MAEFTWRKLKEQINSLREEDLDEAVLWWGDERGGKVNSVWLLDEEYGLFDEGYEPTSSYKDDEQFNVEEDCAHILPKGSPILFVD